MSIASEISRLQAAKASIRQAIQEKGVVVPELAKLDTYGSYIGNIHTQPNLQNKTVNANGQVTADNGYDGLGTVTVNVPSGVNNQNKSVSPSGSQQVVQPDSGYSGLGQVTVAAAQLQSKSVTPSASQQTIQPDSGYYGLSSVVVGAITPSGGSATLVPTAGDVPILYSVDEEAYYGLTTWGQSDESITIPVNGTYKFKFSAYIDGSGQGYLTLFRTRNGVRSDLFSGGLSFYKAIRQSGDFECQAGDQIAIGMRMDASNTGYISLPQLLVCVAQNPWSNVSY